MNFLSKKKTSPSFSKSIPVIANVTPRSAKVLDLFWHIVHHLCLTKELIRRDGVFQYGEDRPDLRLAVADSCYFSNKLSR